MRSTLRNAQHEPMFDLEVVTSGHPPIDETTIAYAKRKITRAAKATPRPVRFGRVKIRLEPHRSIERPAVVEAMLDVDGRVVRVYVAATTAREAIDVAEERLRRQLVDMEHRIAFLRRRSSGVAAPGEWRHEDLPTHRPEYRVRPSEQREIVRHKTFPTPPMSPEEAIVELTMLDHDFYLFVLAATGWDALVRRLPDGSFALATTGPADRAVEPDVPIAVAQTPVPTLTGDEAIAMLDVGGEPFVFYVDEQSGRGTVAYRRFDGNYGVLSPDDAEKPSS